MSKTVNKGSGRKPLVPGLKQPAEQKTASSAPEIPSRPVAVKDSDIPAKPAEKPAKTDDEVGGRGGLDPTRYGDWEINGRCVDF